MKQIKKFGGYAFRFYNVYSSKTKAKQVARKWKKGSIDKTIRARVASRSFDRGRKKYVVWLRGA